MISCRESRDSIDADTSFSKSHDSNEFIKSNILKSNHDISRRVTDILTHIGVASTILYYLTPDESLDFLSTHPSLYYGTSYWLVLMTICSLNQYESSSRKYFTPYHPRLFVIHSIRKLGLNCETCHQLLDGPHGLFACTSQCHTCALFKYKIRQEPYIDGTLRFYLCGNESIITSGKAFLSEPYWIANEDNKEELVRKHGNIFELAQRIYEEKIFFRQYVSKDVWEQSRHLHGPRDEKSYTLRRMIEKLIKCNILNTVNTLNHIPSDDSSISVISGNINNQYSNNSNNSSSSSINDTNYSDMNMSQYTLNNNSDTSNSWNSDMNTNDMLTDSDIQVNYRPLDTRTHTQSTSTTTTTTMYVENENENENESDNNPHIVDQELINIFGYHHENTSYIRLWEQHLPSSLRLLYEEEKLRILQGLRSPPPVGSQPLKDLVKRMFSREGIVLKYLN